MIATGSDVAGIPGVEVEFDEKVIVSSTGASSRSQAAGSGPRPNTDRSISAMLRPAFSTEARNRRRPSSNAMPSCTRPGIGLIGSQPSA